MRRVIGSVTTELDGDAFAAVLAAHAGLVLDLGTGDGKHVRAVARARPDVLVVGLDAGPDAMRPTAAQSARKPAKGGLPNALFVWSAVESLPPGLSGVTEVHCLMPWGSLLRAMVRPDEVVLRAVAEICTPGAPFLITLNLHAWRPPVPEVGATQEPTPESAFGQLAPAYARAGWRLDAAWHPDAAELAALGTSWTRRLGSSRGELAVLALRGAIAP